MAEMNHSGAQQRGLHRSGYKASVSVPGFFFFGLLTLIVISVLKKFTGWLLLWRDYEFPLSWVILLYRNTFHYPYLVMRFFIDNQWTPYPNFNFLMGWLLAISFGGSIFYGLLNLARSYDKWFTRTVLLIYGAPLVLSLCWSIFPSLFGWLWDLIAGFFDWLFATE